MNMAKKKKYRGHYCKICRSVLPNEKFSGKGHAKHICKECSTIIKSKKTDQNSEVSEGIEPINWNISFKKYKKLSDT